MKLASKERSLLFSLFLFGIDQMVRESITLRSVLIAVHLFSFSCRVILIFYLSIYKKYIFLIGENRSTIKRRRIPASTRSAVTCWRLKWQHLRITARRLQRRVFQLLARHRRPLWWPFGRLVSRRHRTKHLERNWTDRHRIVRRLTWFHPCATAKFWRRRRRPAPMTSRQATINLTTKKRWKTVKIWWKNRNTR